MLVDRDLIEGFIQHIHNPKTCVLRLNPLDELIDLKLLLIGILVLELDSKHEAKVRLLFDLVHGLENLSDQLAALRLFNLIRCFKLPTDFSQLLLFCLFHFEASFNLDLVAGAVLLLNVLGSSEASEVSLHHNAHPSAQCFCFFH